MSIPRAVVEAVLSRANGWCEACGGGLAQRGHLTLGPALHHRCKHPRAHTVANIMVVHNQCHNGAQWSIHGRDGGARSYRLGHLVHAGTDPATVAIQVARIWEAA